MILVLGKNGQVAKALKEKLAPSYPCIFKGRDDLDLNSFDAIRKQILLVDPRIVINAAAYTQVDLAEEEEDHAFALNSYAVEKIALACKEINARLIHFSSDYVYDGKKTESYTEEDDAAPLNVYGQSKLLGDRLVVASGCRYLIFRTSWILSSYGKNFLKTIISLSKEREELFIVSDQYGTPTTADWLAEIVFQALKFDIPDGVYNAVPKGETSWYGLASYIIEVINKVNLNSETKVKKIIKVKGNYFNLAAVRPCNSRLDSSKLYQKLPIDIPHWKILVENVIKKIGKS